MQGIYDLPVEEQEAARAALTKKDYARVKKVARAHAEFKSMTNRIEKIIDVCKGGDPIDGSGSIDNIREWLRQLSRR